MSYLHSVLQFGDQRTFRNEIEQLSFRGVWQWDDQGHEQRHLGYKEHEHLQNCQTLELSITDHLAASGTGETNQTVVESHFGGQGQNPKMLWKC